MSGSDSTLRREFLVVSTQQRRAGAMPPPKRRLQVPNSKSQGKVQERQSPNLEFEELSFFGFWSLGFRQRRQRRAGPLSRCQSREFVTCCLTSGRSQSPLDYIKCLSIRELNLK